jgi:hypothetical protein
MLAVTANIEDRMKIILVSMMMDVLDSVIPYFFLKPPPAAASPH